MSNESISDTHPLAGLRVVMIVPGALDNSGGVELCAARLLPSLTDWGACTAIIWRKRHTVQGSNLGAVSDVGLPGPLERLLFGFRASFRASRTQADIIHVQGSEYGWALPLFLRIFRRDRKVVVTTHGSMSAMIRAVRPARNWRSRAYVTAVGTIEKLVYRSSDLVCSVSDHVAEDLHRSGYGGKIVVIPNAINTEIFYPPTEENLDQPPTLTWTGRDAAYKNPDALKQIAEILATSKPDLRLQIVGDHLDTTSPNVANLGRKTQVELAQILRQSTLFISTSFYEGDPLAVKEALACGTPAVVTSAAAQGVESGVNGQVVDLQLRNSSDYEEFAATVVGLLEAVERRDAMAAKCRERFSDLQPATELRRYKAAFSHLVS